jgi:hypothetical protein
MKKNRRAWLNPLSSSNTGWVRTSISDNSYGSYIDAEVTISDCYRQACLDFGFCNEKERDQALKKLDKMLTMLEDLHDDISTIEIKEKDKK